MVVTPSGHVCLKRLLLTKLSENGGVDPFHGAGEQDVPLAEESLVTLAGGGSASTSTSTIMPPRPPNVSSLPNLLGLLQKEYDAIVLELFDTRKALEETRRELSQALYQNDAAVRVIARLAMERDAAQQQLKQWNANGAVAPPPPNVEEHEPQAKRRRQDEPDTNTNTNETHHGKIPESHLSIMIDTWKTLSKERKAKSKAAKPCTAEELSQNLAEMEDAAQSLHKPRSKAGISVMTSHADKTVTAGKFDKQIVCYNHKTSTVDFTIPKVPSTVTSLSLNESFLVSGSVDGKVRLYSTTQDGALQGELDVGTSITTSSKKKHKIVHLTLHPSNQHILVAMESGCIVLCGLSADGTMTIVSTFEPPEQQEGDISYTCGALHPDGLIYGTGTNTGVVHIWDLKNQNLAGTLAGESNDDDAIVSLAFSNNGYHIGTALSKSAKVQVWDLRKLKVVTTLNVGDDDDKNNLKSVHVVAFDTSGKHLAFGGDGGIRITTAKVWGITASLAEDHDVTGILWNNNMNSAATDGNKPYTLVTCSEKERPLRFYGC